MPHAAAALLLLAAAEALSTSTAPRAITGAWPQAFPAKDLCSNCGLCKTDVGIASVTDACAFIGDGMARAEGLEERVHGRSRAYDASNLDEAYFGVHDEILLARGFVDGAQWTGVATGIALAWLEAGEVDAVVVAGSSEDGFGSPEPVLCKSTEDVLRGRRVKPSLCPSLAILDQVRDDASIKRLLFCGVGCSVQALRGINRGDPASALNLDELYVLGTHCAVPKSTLRLSYAIDASHPTHWSICAQALRRQLPHSRGREKIRLHSPRGRRRARRRRRRVRIYGRLPRARAPPRF
jgi:hypothetical protein